MISHSAHLCARVCVRMSAFLYLLCWISLVGE